jgi:hypothetical protein
MHPGRRIVVLVGELERSVADAETALIARDWQHLGELLTEQRRLTHAVANAVDETNGQRPDGFDQEFQRRLKAIELKRADQMRRLQAFNSAVGSRLAVMARAKTMRRTLANPDDRPPILINTLK